MSVIHGPHRLEQPSSIECDVLIVGSGAGGSVVADVLTAAGRDVVMLEEGPFVDSSDVPPSPVQAMPRLWRCGGLTTALGKTPIAYAEGRCVGGGTMINTAIFQRTSPELLDEWAERYEIADFGADHLAPYFDRATKAVNASLTPGDAGPPTEILRRGSQALDWKGVDLERSQADCVGTNFCSSGCPTGGKQSMTVTLIPKALSNGLRLIAECRVVRLSRRGNRVVGAKAEARGHDGRRHPVEIKAGSVFVCAGAMHTPALLRRSRLSRNAGRTLRLHPTIRLAASFDEEINAHEFRVPLYAVTEFQPDLRLGGSMFSPGLFGILLAEDWERREHLLGDWRNCCVYYAMVRAAGVGSVRTVPGAIEPVVQYRMTETDWQSVFQGIVRLGEAMFAAGAKTVYPTISGHPGWTSADECRGFLNACADGGPRSRTNLMTIHIFSSCPPGENPDLCTTDSFGRLNGLENVFVADASQVPEAPGANPQGTIMALAYRNAEAFLGASDAGRRRSAAAEA